MDTFKNLATELRGRVAAYRGAELDSLALAAKVSPRWLLDFREGRAPNPTVESLDGLNNALLKRAKRRAKAARQ